METIFTIGHSTHTSEAFIQLLKAHAIKMLVDIRTIPRSKYNPQFNEDTLKKTLKTQHINYCHMKDLGGLRHPRKDSTNTGWRNKGFKGYADYMETDAFHKALNELIALGKEQTLAIMCAESVPWRCHRSLVSDALLIRQISVQDIFPDGRIAPHKLTSFAKLEGGRILYPAAQATLL